MTELRLLVPAIRTAVRRSRRAIGDDAVATQAGRYELDPATVDIDIDLSTS